MEDPLMSVITAFKGGGGDGDYAEWYVLSQRYSPNTGISPSLVWVKTNLLSFWNIEHRKYRKTD